MAINVPDRNGKMQDVVLGFDDVESYYPENNQTDFGAAIGRYANRINQGHLAIDGKEYQLPRTTSDTACTAVLQAGSTSGTRW